MNLNIKFDNIFDFYKETDILTSWRRINDPGDDWESHVRSENKRFRGLDNKEILASMYSYKEGLDKLKEIELEFNQGSNRKVYKWSDQDGDEMALDRLYDSQAFLQQRVNTNGDRNGKFVNLHISVGENCHVTYSQMLYRSYLSIQIADYLENNGYRVAIFVYSDVRSIGNYNGKKIDNLNVSIQIKKPEEPLNKGLLLNCVSPWMFRYWMFKLWHAKFYTNWGLGSAISPDYKTTKSDIYLETGQCLSKPDVDKKLKQLKKLFNTDDCIE